MATPLDLTTLEGDALDAMRVAIATEQERRQRCEQLPGDLADMARAAAAAGCNRDALIERVTDALATQE